MLFFILLATLVNFVDRTNLGVAAPFLSKELNLDKVQMGQIFAAFGLTYAIALVPGGYIVDLFGSRITAISSIAARCAKPGARILRRQGLLAPSDTR